ncbi:MAG: D-alanyl-D-alanine carboxypeptidase [Clostridia bacterium]|nr:D-alanyl-D-alanine carboxypeptidase [Clostridia bacterium]
MPKTLLGATIKAIIFFCVSILIICGFTTSALAGLNIAAKGAVLIDSATGTVLWGKNADTPLPPASTTKVFTALTALDLMPLDHACLVSPQAAAVGESTADLQAGEELPLADLLMASLVKSANDACYAIGENVAGSERFFLHLLNLKAQALGCYDSRFYNTNGLPAQGHLVTPYNMALAARTAMTSPVFRELVASPTAIMENGSRTRYLKNTNKLLTMNSEVIGIKTGTTNEAGACLAAAMKRNGREVISVVFNSPNRYGESLQLLNYGIDNFINIEYLQEGDAVAYYPVEKAEADGVWLIAAGKGVATVPIQEKENLRVEIEWKANIELPIKAGETLAWANLSGSDGTVYASVNLEAVNSVAKEGIWLLLEKLKQK